MNETNAVFVAKIESPTKYRAYTMYLTVLISPKNKEDFIIFTKISKLFTFIIYSLILSYKITISLFSCTVIKSCKNISIGIKVIPTITHTMIKP